MSLNILDLLHKIGPENITVQPLQSAVTSASTHKEFTEVRFATDQISCGDLMMGKGKVALVIWIPRDKWPEHPEEVERTKLQVARIKVQEAVKAYHEYAKDLEVGEEREKAFAIFENLRMAERVY